MNANKNNYEVILKEVPEMSVISIRMNMSMKTISEDMGKCYEELYSYLQEAGGLFTGEVMAIYHCDENFDPDNFDAECCFSVKAFLPDKGRIKSRLLEGALMAATVHKGSYPELGAAYGAISEWMKANSYDYAGPMRDVYLNDPCNVPEDELLTEVLFPVRKA